MKFNGTLVLHSHDTALFINYCKQLHMVYNRIIVDDKYNHCDMIIRLALAKTTKSF